MLLSSFLWLVASLVPLSLAAPGSDVQQQEPLSEHSRSKKLNLTHDLLGLHRNLASIESISGNELEISIWLATSLRGQGYSVHLQEVAKDRYNVLAWPGKIHNARVLLTSHIDTVPPFYPYTIHENDTTTLITGRGNVDAKASVATQIIAANSLLSSHKISPDALSLLYVVGEEIHGDGMLAANSLHLTPQCIIFGEPTENKLAAGHKGILGLTVHCYGKAAHSGYPWLGRSANEILVAALSGLMALGEKLPRSEKYGSTTINLGRIEGGVAANVVAEKASASVAVRIAAGSPVEIKKAIVKAVRKATEGFESEDGKEVVEVEFGRGSYGPVDIDHDVEGFETIVVNYGTDLPHLEATVEGQRRYLYGPGSILVAHSDHEAITVNELEDAVEGYKKLILHSLQD